MNTQPKFSAETLAKVTEIIKRYPEGKQKSAILPVLHLAEKEFGGYLSVPTMDYVASILSIQPIEVYEVATFYTMFNLKPTGKFVLEVCQTGPCCLLGADQTIAYLEEKLGIKVGQTTADGLFTLKTVECLASCGTAPVMQVDDDYYENLCPEKIDTLIQNFTAEATQHGA
jgi:NADH-quinone oxidoreductase subunit E